MGLLTSHPIFQSCTDHSKDNQTIPTRISNTSATSPHQTQSYQCEQNQQSPSSRVPSPQHLIHTDPPRCFDYSVSSGGCDGTNTNSTIGMAMDGTAHRTSSHLIPASSLRNDPTRGAHGSIWSQCLQYDRQHKAPSKDGCERYNPVATVQFLQNTPSKPFPTVATGIEQLHRFGTGKSSLRLDNGSP